MELRNTDLLRGKRFIITGCGYRPVKKVFYDRVHNLPSHNQIVVDDKAMKLNIGAATAYVLASHGATVHMVSTTEEKLKNLKRDIEEKTGMTGSPKVEYSVVDLLDETSVQTFVESLPKDLPIHWIQSIGLGAGAYQVENENPYLRLGEIPVELIEKESSIVLKGTHIMMQALLPVFERQDQYHEESRIVIISSMSAVRGYFLGGTHCAAKRALGGYTNAAMLELYRKNIYVTDVRPGAIDTGAYDNQVVQNSVMQIDYSYGGVWFNHGITLAQPLAVGQAVAMALIAPAAHVTSINMVAKGQIPHEAS